MKLKVLLIDGNNVAHMGGHGNVMSTQEGMRTEVIFTGLKMVKGYLQEFEPDRVAVVWDGGRDERRKKLFPEYKKRDKPKTEAEEIELELFFHQMETFRHCLVKLGLTNFLIPHREADDVIFNLMVQVQSVGQGLDIEFIVVSTDKDFYQLFKYFDNVSIYNPIKKKLWSGKDLEESLGFPARYYIDYKAVVGDPSDNLPGIKGIGPVGAKALMGTLFYRDTDIEITDKYERWINKFEAGLDDYALMVKLIEFMTLDTAEVRSGKVKEKLTPNELHGNAMHILQHFEFDSLMKKFPDFIYPFDLLLTKERKHEQVEES
jgi:DNA polymerase-1